MANDGFEALAKAILDIDMVLLDVMMPGLDGFEVVRRLRKDQRSLGLPRHHGDRSERKGTQTPEQWRRAQMTSSQSLLTV